MFIVKGTGVLDDKSKLSVTIEDVNPDVKMVDVIRHINRELDFMEKVSESKIITRKIEICEV